MRVYIRLRIAKTDAITKIVEFKERFDFLHDIEQGFCEEDSAGTILIYGSFPQDQLTALKSYTAYEVYAPSLS